LGGNVCSLLEKEEITTYIYMFVYYVGFYLQCWELISALEGNTLK